MNGCKYQGTPMTDLYRRLLVKEIQSQQQRIKALSKVASEARGLLDSIQSGSLSRNNCENLSMELIEDIDKALTDTTKADEGE